MVVYPSQEVDQTFIFIFLVAFALIGYSIYLRIKIKKNKKI